MLFRRLFRNFFLLLIAALFTFSTTWACANEYTYFHEDQQIGYAKSCLTEVFGYSYETAEVFVFEQTQQDGVATVRYWHPDFPDWVYTSQFSLTDGSVLGSNTPFGSSHHGYPGENSVRYILTQVEQEQLLTNWNKAARERFRAILEQDGLQLSAELEKGLMTATYTAQEAVEDFFITCYDTPENWPEAVTEWYEWLLDTYQLKQVEPKKAADGVARYRSEGNNPMVLTEFVRSIPPELVDALKHPMLENWDVLSGAMVVFEGVEEPRMALNDLGLIAFGKGEERLLCLLMRNPDDNEWSVQPVSKTALPAGCQPIITRSDPLTTRNATRYRISFSTNQAQDVTMLVGMYWQEDGKRVCRLRECQFADAATGHVYQASEADSVFQVSCIKGQGTVDRSVTVSHCAYPSILTYLDFEDFREAITHPEEGDCLQMPAGMVFTSGVHLRKETSSHSKDLGMLNPGTMARKISIQSGDPNAWYQVEIGLLKGYVSSVYVEETLGRTAQLTLPVAITIEECSLKEHTGLFAPEVAKVSAGTSMHIIMDCGSWYYVCVPQAQPAGMWMDPAGTYGYIKADHVTVGTSALQLEWQLSEEQ